MLSKFEKFVIAATVVILFAIVWAISVPSQNPDQSPVQNVNKSCCSANECAAQHHHEKVANEAMTNRQLQRYYQQLNEDYYLGQLSKNVEVKWGDLTANNWMGYTEQRAGGYVIIIDRATNPTSSGAFLTIAHETCHIKTWGQEVVSHGSKFQNCMVNLATHGAFEGSW